MTHAMQQRIRKELLANTCLSVIYALLMTLSVVLAKFTKEKSMRFERCVKNVLMLRRRNPNAFGMDFRRTEMNGIAGKATKMRMGCWSISKM